MAKILVIDDNLGTRETLGSILRFDGFDVTTAATAFDGLTALGTSSFDLVLAGLRQRDMTASHMLQRLRQEGTTIPFVVMTAFGTVSSAVEAMKLGASDYVEKPLSEVDVIAVVRSALCLGPQRQALSSGVVSTGDRHPTEDQGHVAEGIDERVARALRAIDERFGDRRLHLSVIAHECDVSVEHLCRLFKRDAVLAFDALLRQKRTTEARKLLLGTNLLIKDIAFRTGYSPARLAYHFKKVYGTTPATFRALSQ
jgi:YesN/AraC family two-component response regulator